MKHPCRRRERRESGVVLISTLLILMVLSLIISVYMLQARQQIRYVTGLQEKTGLCITAESRFDQLLFVLLTRDRNALQGVRAAELSGVPEDTGIWNYSGQVFTWHGSEVRMQDMAGLMSVAQLPGQAGRRLLAQLGVGEREQSIFLNSLADWQDADDLHRLDGAEADWYRQQGLPVPRNAPLASLAELRLVRGFPDQLEELLQRGLITLHPETHFNPLTAPAPLLAAFLHDSTLAASLLELREQHRLDALGFAQRTGIHQSDGVLYAPSLRTRVQVGSEGRLASCTVRWVVDARGNIAESFTLRPDH